MDNLEEEQEKILSSLSQVLPGMSSQETLLNPEEAEEFRNEAGVMTTEGREEKCVKHRIPHKKSKNSCPFTTSRRKCVRRKKKSQAAKKRTAKEENDSGFATSSEVLKSMEMPRRSDSEGSVTSLESVSLLQIASNTPMELDGASAGVNLAWNVKIFPPIDDDEEKATTDKAVQTEHAPHSDDGSIMKTVNFIGSVIRLKQILFSKTNISRGEFEKILKRLPEEVESCGVSSGDEMEVAEDGIPFIAVKRRRDVVSCETVRYILRRTNAEDVMEKSVDAVLAWIKEETEKDWRTVCCCWTGSITAEAVDVINEAADSDVVDIRKRVSAFLRGIYSGIHDGDIEDTVQEFKVSFLSNFCKSVLLQYDLINHIIKKLSGIDSKDWVNTEHEVATAKLTYFSLRLLKNLLRSFLNTNQTEFLRVRPRDTQMGVLNMWKENWRRSDTVSDDILAHTKYLQVIRGWCSQTDSILNFAMKECPLLSLISQQCSSLSREILSKMSAQIIKEFGEFAIGV